MMQSLGLPSGKLSDLAYNTNTKLAGDKIVSSSLYKTAGIQLPKIAGRSASSDWSRALLLLDPVQSIHLYRCIQALPGS